MSHPSWVCGLKQTDNKRGEQKIQSHPSWVCGLKLALSFCLDIAELVTPFVGVWIETT